MKKMSGNLFKMSESDLELFRIFRSAHKPSNKTFNIKAIFQVTQHILHQFDDPLVGATVNSELQKETPESDHQKFSSLELIDDAELDSAINNIYYEMIYNYNRRGQLKDTVESISKELSQQQWHAKVVIVLAAFALAYGEFRLIAKSHKSRPDRRLASSIAAIKQLPNIVEIAEHLTEQLDDAKRNVVEVIQLILQLADLKLKTRAIDGSLVTDIASVLDDTEIIAKASFYATLTIVACAKRFTKITWFNYEKNLELDLVDLSRHLQHLTPQLKLYKDDWEWENKLAARLEEIRKLKEIEDKVRIWYWVSKVATYGTGVMIYVVEKVCKFKEEQEPLLINMINNAKKIVYENALPFTKNKEQEIANQSWLSPEVPMEKIITYMFVSILFLFLRCMVE